MIVDLHCHLTDKEYEKDLDIVLKRAKDMIVVSSGLNLEDNKKVLDLVRSKFNYEDYDFKVHFPVLLIQRKVIENLYGKEYFKKLVLKI